MQINLNTTDVDWRFEQAEQYLPVRLSTSYFEAYGECIVIVANRVEGMFTNISENKDSEVFISLMNRELYEEVKEKVLSMEYWIPNTHYNTFNGLADGVQKKIHLDGSIF